ncbi:MAG TPA: AAA family ATPase [Sporichthyaceae bacterium]|jgi:class 3 adenylate cyclase/tetratricopeptide (TPR) repeat protein
MAERASALVTILFTDLVGSTELLSRAGDEDAQRIFRAHHKLLADVASGHGGAEVKWLGDGLMASFASAADALRCAISMQQSCQRPVAGQRLSIRVGLNTGEAFRDEVDFFGTPVVVARRLCDHAAGGQILCSELVAGLLAGRVGFAFVSLGALELKGVPDAVSALEVRYEVDAAPALGGRLPFVGRQDALARLVGRLAETAAGHGGLMFVAGEPGIGKTRLTEELAEAAAADGFSVLWGHCLDGDWAPPYAPFAEAVEAMVDRLPAEELRADLGAGGPVLAQLVPALHQRVSELPDVAPVQPDEARFRVLDAMAQFLAATARRVPVLLCLDDLHWADASTVAMLRHVVRTSRGQRMLVVGTYRDAEVGAGHPLHDALGDLRRQVEFERLKLEGLEAKAVAELLEAIADHDVLGSVAAAIATETAGNPFFIKEVLRHLFDEGRFLRGPDGRWISDRPPAELGIPKGVREVIGRRLARLSADANRLLSAASVFEGDIHLGVVTTVAGISEDVALDALDEALDAQLLQPAGAVDVYRFTQDLIRHTISEELSPSRRARLHLRAAQVLSAAAGGKPGPGMVGEIATQFHRGRGLPGAEEGVATALAAAGHSEATGGQAEAARFLRMALELMAADDPRRPRILGQLGMALIWSLAFDNGLDVAAEAGHAIDASEGQAAAAEYFAAAALAIGFTGNNVRAWDLAREGLAHTADRRDLSWAHLYVIDSQRRDFGHPEHPGIPLDTPERWEAARLIRASRPDPVAFGGLETPFGSRAEAVTSTRNLSILVCFGGEFERCLPLAMAEAQASLARGQAVRGARCFMTAAFCQLSLGRLEDGRASLEEAERLAEPTGTPIFGILHGWELLTAFLDDEVGLAALAARFGQLIPTLAPGQAWALGPAYAICARTCARLGRSDEALGFLEQLLPWLERAPAWSYHFPDIAGYSAETLWLLGRVDHIDVVEQAVREKVLAPDFRDIGVDSRLSLARLCTLRGRYEEAQQWFGEARSVLREQSALPLLAMADFDQAQMFMRRSDRDDAQHARALLEVARIRFEEVGMRGWVDRTDQLLRQSG